MNMGDKNKIEKSKELALPAHTVAAVAISGSKKSKPIISWALEKFVPEGLMYFKLLHVRPMISRIPTPTTVGNYIPISQVREDVADAFRKEVQYQVNEKLLPYKRMCSQRKVQVEVVQIESDDVGAAISGYIEKHKIIKLVIGTSSRNIFSRSQPLSSKISECCPPFCTVFAVSKGLLSSMRPSDSVTNRSFDDESSEASSSTDNSSTLSSSSQPVFSDWTVKDSFIKSRSPSLPEQRFQALSTMNQILLNQRRPSNGTMHPRSPSLDTNGLDLNYTTSVTYTEKQEDNINFELENMRIELRNIRGMYAMAQGEAIDASRKLNELEKRRLVEETNFKQISCKEEEAKELAKQEKKRYKAAKKEAAFVNECAEREALERKEAEARASRETKEKENLESTMNGCVNQYRQFTWEEIASATSSFSDHLKIGKGAFGTVYRCSFHHTVAAVKILHAKEASVNSNKQFQLELEILSQIRHPHLLILLGACPERSCLVYEYMENGSLEDCLTMKNNAPPLPWFDRFRIAWEVASALVFLHESTPKSIIHRDLKPANILLDRNLVSKIGDVGLSTMVGPESPFSLSSSSTFSDNGLVGTLCYIDPEYQRTGVITPKSDVYAFGMVILQLLTGKPAIALAYAVENAVSNGSLGEMLDSGGGGWPGEETRDLAVIGLKCTELRQRDRPDLREEVLPVLERLKEFAERGRDSTPPEAPKHFVCPIVNEVMDDPCVAGDGYTYDREAIEAWVKENDTSPVTGLRLAHKYLTPNYTLLSAIMEWKSGKET